MRPGNLFGTVLEVVEIGAAVQGVQAVGRAASGDAPKARAGTKPKRTPSPGM